MDRLQKVIAYAGVASRRKAEELILAGRVKVNDKVIKELGTKVSKKDAVEVDGVLLSREELVYYVLNKPSNCMSATYDDRGRVCVTDFFEGDVLERIYPIGRLDYDTIGVLLLTNDGEFTQTMLRPEFKIEKEYVARVEGLIRRGDTAKIERGVDIGDYITKPCNIVSVEYDRTRKSSLVTLIVKEGKYHQIKRMFEVIGFKVKKLRRKRFGIIDVEGMPQGTYRKLTIHEVKTLKELAKGNIPNKEQFERQKLRPSKKVKMRQYK